MNHSELNTNQYINIKASFIGNSGSGKTSIIEKYLYNQFNHYVTPTIGNSVQVKKISFNNKKILLCINDTAGQERFNCMPKLYYRNIHAFVLVYDITDSSSFNNLKYWLEELYNNNNNNNNYIIYIVGNKLDRDKYRFDTPPNLEKNIKQNYVDLFGNDNNNMFYIEVSAKTGFNIDNMMNKIIQFCLNNTVYDINNSIIDNNIPLHDKKSSDNTHSFFDLCC